MTIRSARCEGIAQLASSPTPALDTDVLLEYSTGCSRSCFLSHGETELTAQQITDFTAAVALRQTGLPVAYITGHKEFYGIDFLVTKDVLIPKPDTELMVEHALNWITGNAVHILTDSIRIADICTGSGCIGLSLLHELRIPVSLTLTDISAAALSIARQNALHVLPQEQQKNISFLQGDLLQAVPENTLFTMLLSNPPYIPAAEVTGLLRDGRSEPRLALDGDAGTADGTAGSSDGLAVIRRLVPQAFAHLAHGGIFMLETGEYNAEEAALLIKKTGFTQVTTYRDLAGQLRLTTGSKQ
ncbi:MAG: peptide chain release factor N(5)-glutamine methyltransferase [Treponema sp.]|nr:peptide chain release factor N(5)-glutamine methyltransferase [Treponema sp.]